MRAVRTILALIFLSLLTSAAEVPGTSISLDPPPGMTPAARFAGFENALDGVFIMVSEMPSPYEASVSGLRDPARLEQQRMRLEKSEKVKLVSGYGELFVFKQLLAGVEYRKLLLAFGNEKRTYLLSAGCSTGVAGKWESPLRASLLTVTLGASRGSAVGFRLQPKGTLKQVSVMTGAITFTAHGQFPVKDPRTALFIATRSFAAVPAMPNAQLAETTARALRGVSNLRISQSKPVEIDGLDGHELVGVANESSPSGSKLVYEVVLRDPAGGYYALVGLVANEQAGTYLPVFREMSATFSRK